ncbi:hypothetical protein EDB89DRAFT_399786 [Lactarius sanguifluus]|nr:hypothetical protein EDB89DRAFT_399786 [Lactarius sanguifluus]
MAMDLSFGNSLRQLLRGGHLLPPYGLIPTWIMSLIIDCIRPSQLSTPSIPQLRVDLKDALQTLFLTRILTLSANILEAAGACTFFSGLPRSQLQTTSIRRQVRTILHDRWDPPPYGVKAPLDQLESLLLTIANWMYSLSQARFLTQIFKRIQVKRKIEELKLSLIDCISVLQYSIFEEACRTLRLDGTHRVVFPPRADLVLRLRLARRPELTYPRLGPHVHSRDRDGVSSLAQ